MSKYFDTIPHEKLLIALKERIADPRVLHLIKLWLKVPIVESQKLNFLRYSFYKVKGKGRLRLHPKTIFKMKTKLKELTSRSNGWGNERRKEKLRQYIIGWVHYFKLADMKTLLVKIDEWYRRWLRMVIWKQWKQIRTKMANLMKLGVERSKAWEWAKTRKGYWHVANSFILSTSITNKRFRQAGYIFLMDYYLNVRVVN